MQWWRGESSKYDRRFRSQQGNTPRGRVSSGETGEPRRHPTPPPPPLALEKPLMSTRDVVIIAGARTPQAKMNGGLSSLTAPELGAHALRAAIDRSGLDASTIDTVIMGNVLTAGLGQ